MTKPTAAAVMGADRRRERRPAVCLVRFDDDTHDRVTEREFQISG